MVLMTALAIVGGAILGTLIHRLLGSIGALPTDQITIGSVSGRDLIVIAVSIVMIMFGGKVSQYVTKMGYGMLAWQVGHEIKDLVWDIPANTGAGATTTPQGM